MTDSRFTLLQDLMDADKNEVIALNPGSTLTYLTGLHFHLMERPTVLLYKRGFAPHIILPELEKTKLNQSRIGLIPFTYNDNPASWQLAFTQAVTALELRGVKLGVESNRLRFLEMEFLRKAIQQVEFSAADNMFYNLRILKDADEVQLMRRAVVIAQNAFINILPLIKPGVSEKTIAAELTMQMLRMGADPELPFAPIVAGGPNSANPHAVPSERLFESGDLVVIDWGAKVEGYCSDLTRTVGITTVSPELLEIYETVLKANLAARAAGKPGVQAGVVDEAARQVIDDAGYGPYFTHRTGHGLGMEEHETPYIFSANQQLLKPGMVYTVEPGIYLPGKGGVRIEDDILITSTSSESLSDLPREIRIL